VRRGEAQVSGEYRPELSGAITPSPATASPAKTVPVLATGLSLAGAGSVAKTIQPFGLLEPKQTLEAGKRTAFVKVVTAAWNERDRNMVRIF
jgi:hypothetical protein